MLTVYYQNEIQRGIVMLQKAPPIQKAITSEVSAHVNSSSGYVRRSGALSSSGSGGESAAVQPAVGAGRSVAVPRHEDDVGRKRTSKDAEVGSATRRSTPGTTVNGEVKVSATRSLHADVASSKTSDHAANHQKSDRSQDRTLNGHADAHITVAKDATAAASPAARTDVGVRTSAVDRRRTFDAEPVPVENSGHKATTPTSDKPDSDQTFKIGHKEAPAVVAKDAATAVAGGPRSSTEADRIAAETTATDKERKEDGQLSPVSVSIEHKTDIKPVNPDMAIFDVLHRQQASKRQSGSEEDKAQHTSTDKDHSNDSEPQINAVIICSLL